MARYRITHSTTYLYSDPVPVCQNQLRLSPRDTPWTHCSSHRLAITPRPDSKQRRRDWFGNYVQSFSLQESHRKLSVTAKSLVEVRPQSVPDPAETMTWEEAQAAIAQRSAADWLEASEFVFDSPHIARASAFRKFAEPCFPTGQPVLAGAVALTSKIFSEFKYDPRATTVTTRPEEVLQARHGVCQDFAHLEIASLRSLGLPARYVSGYLRTTPPPGKPRLTGADASHAWISVWCGPHGWIDLDPTNNCICSTDHIPIAWGRDYSDVAPFRGVYLGGGTHTLNVSVDVEPLDEPEARESGDCR
jgi:transglutaminase-like putative cysteine protease